MMFVGSSRGSMQIFDLINWKEMAHFEPGHGVASQAVPSGEQRFMFVSEGSNLMEMEYGWINYQ
jgi:hypothetical protein